MNNRPPPIRERSLSNQCLPQILYQEGNQPQVLGEDLETTGEEKGSRWMKFVQRNKEQLRRRFLKEYVHAFGERKSNSTSDNLKIPDTGAAVLLKSEAKDKAL